MFMRMQFKHTSKHAGGLAIPVDQGSVYGGHDDGVLFAVNTTSGAKLWKFDTKMTPACPIRTGGNLFVAEGLALFGCGPTLWAVNTTVAGGGLAWSAVVAPGGTVMGVSYHPQQDVGPSPSTSQMSGTVLATANSAAGAVATLAAYSAYDGNVRVAPSASAWAKDSPCSTVSSQPVPSWPGGACTACVYLACDSGVSGAGSAMPGAIYAFALDVSFEQSAWSLFWYSSIAAGVGSGIAVGPSGEVYYGTKQSAALQAVSAFQ